MKTLGWVASFFSLLGVVLNALMIIWCWPVWCIGNTLWMVWSYRKKEYAQFILWIVFTLANFYGWYNWSTLTL